MNISRRALASITGVIALLALGGHTTAQAQTVAAQPPTEPLSALPSLDVPAYMGTWYQVAWFPNRFQKQCVSDTRAEYRQREDGRIEVINRCRLANGQFDEADGIARTAGSTLQQNRLSPATLEVSFLPPLLRWLPAWGSYWVIALADDEATIRSTLLRQGFDLSRWQAHPHTPDAPSR